MTTKTINTNWQMETIFAEASEAARQAVQKCQPTPMVVGEETSPFSNDIDYSKPTYVVEGGVCGFAWVTIKPARGKFVQWLKSQNIGYNGYYGGWQVASWKFADGGQSMQRNIAACEAVCAVLRDKGIQCYVESRMD